MSSGNEGVKVLQLLYSGLGGHGSVAFSLLEADKEGEWIPSFGFIGVDPLLEDYKTYCQQRNIAYEYFSAVSGKPWSHWSRLYSWLNANKPQVIILHAVTSLFPVFLFARVHNIPLIIVEHQANSLKNPADWVYSAISLLMADHIVYLTKTYRDQIKKELKFIYPKNIISVIPNGIDAHLFSPLNDKKTVPQKQIRLGMASRFTAIKRHDILLDMMRILYEISPSVNWQLTLAGDGDAISLIHDQVHNLGLIDCVEMPGQLGGNAFVAWFQSLDFYVHASDGETLSTALLQAMSIGLPIVASEVTGITELLGGVDFCGALVREPYAQGFAEAVINMIDHEEITSGLSFRCRKKILEEFSQEIMFSRYSELVKVLYKKNKQPDSL